MRYSSRFFLYAPLALLLALAAGVSAYWWVVAGAASARFDAINGREAVPGIRLSFAQKTLGGFPFRVDTVLDGVKVEITSSYGPIVWRSEHLASHALTYGRAVTLFEAAGTQLLTWTDDGGVHHRFEFIPGTMRASIVNAKDAFSRFDLDVMGVASPSFDAARAQFHLRRDPSADALDLVFSADDVRLAPQWRNAIGNAMPRIRLDARLLPATPLLAGGRDWHSNAESWRVQQGALVIDQLEIAWGKLDAFGTGHIALDGAHRPAGGLELKIAGYQTLLDEAAARGLVKPADKGVAAALLHDMAETGGDHAGRLPATFTFKDGAASVGKTSAGLLPKLY
jgi:hypothetical protein